MIPFGFGQENGISEKIKALYKILLLDLFNDLNTVRSLLAAQPRVEEKTKMIDQEQLRYVYTVLHLDVRMWHQSLAGWGHFCYLR